MVYQISVKGHKNSYPVKDVLKNCWGYEYSQVASFGWDAINETQRLGISEYEISQTVAISAIPPWLFPVPVVDLNLLEEINDLQRKIPKDLLVKQYID